MREVIKKKRSEEEEEERKSWGGGGKTTVLRDTFFFSFPSPPLPISHPLLHGKKKEGIQEILYNFSYTSLELRYIST